MQTKNLYCGLCATPLSETIKYSEESIFGNPIESEVANISHVDLSKFRKPFFASLFIVGVAISVWFIAKSRENKQINPITQTTVEPILQTLSIDSLHLNIVLQLMNYEQERNLAGITSCFANEIKQYWNFENLSNKKLCKIYTDAWQKTISCNYDSCSYTFLNGSVIVTATYFQVYPKSNTTKKTIQNVYLFDNNNKIVSANSTH